MKSKLNLDDKLSFYLKWPILLSILLIIMNISIYFVNRLSGIIVTVFVLIYIILVLSMYMYKRYNISKELIRFAMEYGQVQKKLLKDLAIPYAILDEEGSMLWGNNEFIRIIKKDRTAKKSITNIFAEITKDIISQIEEKQNIQVVYEDKNYKAELRRITVSGLDINESISEINKLSKGKDELIVLYLFDETEIIKYKTENSEQSLILGLIYIDNYEEALDSIDEVKRSLLLALVDRKINKYMSSFDAITKKLERDKFIVLFKNKYLPQIQADKFSVLSDVRSINIGNNIAVTLSIGLGASSNSYVQGYDSARASIDLALGRGGDQAVIKEGEKIFYYGGKTKQVEKTTRVKARVKAHALKELVEAKDKVVIMGHSIGDVDSFGASIGVYRIAKSLNKRAYIVINEITSAVRPFREGFGNNQEYEPNMFLNSHEATEMVDNNTLLVVVDVNRPSYTECKELLERTKTIVVLDHHRQCGEVIENAVLSYIETYASSACEMVAEILQYIGNDLKLKPIEAEALYAGIMIDTNNFLNKTGVRTFEAAAFLRRNGADVTKVRKSFRNDEASYKARAQAIRNSEIYKDHFVIAVGPSTGIESPTIIGAQVANELLNIVGIKASFVLTWFNNKIYVSARSIDEANVQIIMEKFGGGGHMTVAGAQMVDCNVYDAIDKLKKVLDEMIQEGEL